MIAQAIESFIHRVFDEPTLTDETVCVELAQSEWEQQKSRDGLLTRFDVSEQDIEDAFTKWSAL